MSRNSPTGGSAPSDGGRTAVAGTPVAVDVSRDRRARITWVVFLAGPVTWFAHFMLVYLVGEAGCTGDGPGLRLLNTPVPTIVTLAATGAATVACVGFARWAYVRWRASEHERAADEARDLSGDLEDQDRGGSMAFVGLLLSLLFFVAILFVGLPALVLPAC
jgi:hypothetical protein